MPREHATHLVGKRNDRETKLGGPGEDIGVVHRSSRCEDEANPAGRRRLHRVLIEAERIVHTDRTLERTSAPSILGPSHCEKNRVHPRLLADAVGLRSAIVEDRELIRAAPRDERTAEEDRRPVSLAHFAALNPDFRVSAIKDEERWILLEPHRTGQMPESRRAIK